MKQPKKTGKHVFWRLKITKKNAIQRQKPRLVSRETKKTAKITTINNDFFAVTGKVVS